MSPVSAVMRGAKLRRGYGVLPGQPLTQREQQVLLGASKGLTYAEIARRLGLSTHTIKAHARHALVKLGAAGMTHAVALYLAAGLPHTQERSPAPTQVATRCPRCSGTLRVQLAAR